MKNGIIFAMTHFSVIVGGAEIPHAIVNAVAAVEGGKPGMTKIEPNGQRSYGVHQISRAFLDDVNRHYGTRFSVSAVRDKHKESFLACSMGIAMIMNKRGCGIKTALAAYNGGWKNRNRRKCMDYAERVMSAANTESEAPK